MEEPFFRSKQRTGHHVRVRSDPSEQRARTIRESAAFDSVAHTLSVPRRDSSRRPTSQLRAYGINRPGGAGPQTCRVGTLTDTGPPPAHPVFPFGARPARRDRAGTETGTASVNTMGSGHLSGPALHNGWQHSINAGPRRQPRLVVPGLSFRRSAPAVERSLRWGKKSAVPTADFPSFRPSPAQLPPFARQRFSCARTALRHGFGTENRASRTLLTTPAKRRHRLFTFFLLAASTTYVRGPLLTHNPSPILVRGPESGISEG